MTKIDAKVGALILEHMLTLENVVLYSDFCTPKELGNLYDRIYKNGRPDPSAAETTSSRKPSHSSSDMYHILNGLAKNITSGKVQSIQLIKVRPGTEGWARLAKGVKDAAQLQTLKI